MFLIICVLFSWQETSVRSGAGFHEGVIGSGTAPWPWEWPSWFSVTTLGGVTLLPLPNQWRPWCWGLSLGAQGHSEEGAG